MVTGQFTMLYLFGVGEVPILISGDAAYRMKLVHTIRAEVARVFHTVNAAAEPFASAGVKYGQNHKG